MMNDSVNTQDSVLGDYINGNVNDSDVPEVSVQPADAIYANMRREDHNALNKVLLETLNPQLRLNEVQKRKFKENLMKYVQIVLSAQIILVSLAVLVVCLNICFKIPFVKDLNSEQINTIFSFFKYYITAIIAEFIAMLFFIVKFVFDKSIVDLTKSMSDNK